MGSLLLKARQTNFVEDYDFVLLQSFIPFERNNLHWFDHHFFGKVTCTGLTTIFLEKKIVQVVSSSFFSPFFLFCCK